MKGDEIVKVRSRATIKDDGRVRGFALFGLTGSVGQCRGRSDSDSDGDGDGRAQAWLGLYREVY
jgi:hypothetical protein